MLDIKQDYCIGDSPMDHDMQIVESIVKSYHENNNIASLSVKYYYLFAISNFWGYYKDFILSIDNVYLSYLLDNISSSGRAEYIKELKEWIEKTIKNKIYSIGLIRSGILMHMWERCKDHESKPYYRDDIVFFLQNTIEYVDILKNNVKEDEKTVMSSLSSLENNFYIIDATKCMLTIANKYCISRTEDKGFNSPEFNPKFLKDNIYPLYSKNGHYAYNTYLYALFNNIILVGIPSDYSMYDGKMGCPEAFYRHDGGHIITDNINDDDLSLLSIIYQKIILDKNLPKMLKEELIHTMFYWIHEENEFFNTPKSILHNMYDILRLYKKNQTEFYREYEIHLTELDSLLVENFIELNGINEMDKNILDHLLHENKRLGYNQNIELKLKENLFYTDTYDQYVKDEDESWIINKAKSIRYFSCLCNMRLMRYISDNTDI